MKLENIIKKTVIGLTGLYLGLFLTGTNIVYSKNNDLKTNYRILTNNRQIVLPKYRLKDIGKKFNMSVESDKDVRKCLSRVYNKISNPKGIIMYRNKKTIIPQIYNDLDVFDGLKIVTISGKTILTGCYSGDVVGGKTIKEKEYDFFKKDSKGRKIGEVIAKIRISEFENKMINLNECRDFFWNNVYSKNKEIVKKLIPKKMTNSTMKHYNLCFWKYSLNTPEMKDLKMFLLNEDLDLAKKEKADLFKKYYFKKYGLRISGNYVYIGPRTFKNYMEMRKYMDKDIKPEHVKMYDFYYKLGDKWVFVDGYDD